MTYVHLKTPQYDLREELLWQVREDSRQELERELDGEESSRQLERPSSRQDLI